MLTLIGILAGLVLAAGTAGLWRLLRRRALVPTAIVGFLALAYAMYNIVLLTRAYLTMRNNPMADRGPFWGMLALAIGVVLLICVLIALLQSLRSPLPWGKFFGCMIAEAGFAIGAGMLLNEFHYSIADVIRHGSRDIPEILHSFDQSRSILGAADTTLFWALTLWEFGSLYSRQFTGLPLREHRSSPDSTLPV